MFCLMARILKSLPVLLLALALFFSLLSCTDETPLAIGFVGGMTGRVADLGVAGRDGVTLAVEEINSRGGIAGRKVELHAKDDRQKPEAAVQAVRELLSKQVVGIIGPMTSSIGAVVQPVINSGKTVMISPTVKTDQLSGQDDFFLRVTTPLSRNAEKIAKHAVNDLGLKKFAVVLDMSNRAFTETWFEHFARRLNEQGGEITNREEFKSQHNVYYLPIAERIVQAKPDGVLLLCNAIDTALLAQQFRKLGSDVVLFSSEWAFTTDLLSFGGRAVNGMTSYHSFNANSQDQHYLDFRARFNKRFGYAPSFASVLAYDATSVLFAGLEKGLTGSNLKQAIIEQGTFQGLQSQIVLDRYGDVERRLFLTVVENGKFMVVE